MVVSVVDPEPPRSLLQRQLRLEARVGIGHLSPRLQGQNGGFSEGTKRNLPLLAHYRI